MTICRTRRKRRGTRSNGTKTASVPAQVESAAVNKWLFNADTVDKALEQLMTEGLKVADGDRLGKTIIFAKNHDHADFIVERFDENYPHLKGSFARVIDFKTEYAQSLIDDFSQPDKPPHIAVSVDMLDTGIDVPEVVNLVFFKIVRSKTKFWQMLGRGTRLCPDLFGPGRHKEYYLVFDLCQNFEFFNQNPEIADGATGDSLSKRLFAERVSADRRDRQAVQADRARRETTGDYQQVPTPVSHASEPGSAIDVEAQHRELRGDVAERLRDEILAMSVDNFIVRPKRRYVEKFAEAEIWSKLGANESDELIEHVAGLPSALEDDDLAAKEFDLLILRTQLAVLRAEPAFAGLRDKIIAIAGLLEEISNVPMVAKELELILEVQTEDFWQDIACPTLETVRRRLRALIKLIEIKRRPIVYTDFEDEIGASAEIEIRGVNVGTDMDRFRAKARHFLKENANRLAVLKLRRNEPLTPTDLDELERIFVNAGTEPAQIEAIRAEGGLGLFVRSLVGLDREAAKKAFAGFLAARKPTADQIEFVNMIVDHLTDRGVMEPRLLYESPFIDINPLGVEGVFGQQDAAEVISIIDSVNRRAAA